MHNFIEKHSWSKDVSKNVSKNFEAKAGFSAILEKEIAKEPNFKPITYLVFSLISLKFSEWSKQRYFGGFSFI